MRWNRSDDRNDSTFEEVVIKKFKRSLCHKNYNFISQQRGIWAFPFPGMSPDQGEILVGGSDLDRPDSSEEKKYSIVFDGVLC